MDNTYENDFGTGTTESTTTQPDTLDKYGAKISARQLSKETGASAVFITKLYDMGKIKRHPATTAVRIFYTVEAIPIIKEIREQRALRGKSRITGKVLLNVLEDRILELEKGMGIQRGSITILQKTVELLEHIIGSKSLIIASQDDLIESYDKALERLGVMPLLVEGD